MLISELLNEMLWADRFSAAGAARAFPNDWIHFASIRKLGVHPSKTHRDPPGIYFYPTRWLLGEEPSLSQFATEHPFYYVVRLKKSPQTVNLGRVSEEDVRALAERNGWLADYERVLANPKLLDALPGTLTKRQLVKPGRRLYAIADYLVNVEGRAWLKLLRGVDALVDPGLSIIAKGEPAQAVVFNRGIMTILDHGENRDGGPKAYADLMQRLATSYGGTFSYRHRHPVAQVEIDGNPITATLRYNEARLLLSYFEDGFPVEKVEKLDSIQMSYDNAESAYRTLSYALKSAAKTASPTGRESWWFPRRLRDAFEMINNKLKPKDSVNDGVFGLFAVSSFGRVYFGLNARVKPDESAVFSASLSYGDLDAEAEITFKAGDDAAMIASQVLDQLAQSIWSQKDKTTLRLDKLEQATGFRFGSRLVPD